MTRILILDIPAPCELLSSNKHLPWQRRAALTRKWRAAGKASVPATAESFNGKVRIVAKVWKKKGGRYDVLNFWPTIKAAVDGIVDAGILEDDSYKHVIGPDMRHGGFGEARILITITEYHDEM